MPHPFNFSFGKTIAMHSDYMFPVYDFNSRIVFHLTPHWNDRSVWKLMDMLTEMFATKDRTCYFDMIVDFENGTKRHSIKMYGSDTQLERGFQFVQGYLAALDVYKVMPIDC